MVTNNPWTDGDGLIRKFGLTKVVPNIAGEYRVNGPLREIELRIDLSTMTTTSTTIQSHQEFFPKNAYIEEVVLEVTAASVIASGTPTFAVGLIQTDTTTATTPVTSSWTTGKVFIADEVDSGVLNTLGKKITYTAGVAKAGGGIGLASAQVGYITAYNSGSGSWTSGNVNVRIRYRTNAL
jgi:hypothetical protein